MIRMTENLVMTSASLQEGPITPDDEPTSGCPGHLLQARAEGGIGHVATLGSALDAHTGGDLDGTFNQMPGLRVVTAASIEEPLITLDEEPAPMRPSPHAWMQTNLPPTLEAPPRTPHPEGVQEDWSPRR